MNHDLDGRGLEAAREDNGLLPCPLCDTAVVARWSAIPRRFAGQIHCDGCGLEMTRYGTDLDERQVRLTLVAAWNRRSPALPAIGEVAVRDLLADLLEALKELADYYDIDRDTPRLKAAFAAIAKAEGASLLDHGQHSSQVVSQEGGAREEFTAEQVEAAARALCVAKGINPDAAHYGTSDGDISDGVTEKGQTFYWGWRNQVKYVTPVLAAYRALSTPLTEKAKAEHVANPAETQAVEVGK